MKTRLLHLWDNLTSSYWFIPSTMLIAAAVGAVFMLWIDRNWTAPLHSFWIYTGGPEGARSLLSTVAGSVITVAGVVFSITIATLVQASSQFGPRLLRNFMRDTGNQVVLGTFVATFFYCLLILRSIRGLDNASFVPNLSVTVGVMMAVGSLAVLIYFIDHISRSLQGPQVVAAVGGELRRAIQQFPSDTAGQQDGNLDRADDARRIESLDLTPVLSCESGYLQAIDEQGLLKIAQGNDLIIHLSCRPGDFVLKNSPLLRFEGKQADTEKLQRALPDLFFLGRQRTAEQDVEYSIRQLVEIAVRALSPGINDPFTAMNCIDWLGAAVSEIAQRPLPGAYRYDSHGNLRVVAKVSTFSGIANASFNQIRQFGGGSVSVILRLLEVIAHAGGHMRTNEQRKVLAHHAEMIYRASQQKLQEPSDLKDVKARYDAAMNSLRGGAAFGQTVA